MADVIDNVRQAVTERAELPGMSLMEHLAELRTRIIHSVLYLLGGCLIAWVFHTPLVNFIQKPLMTIGLTMTMTHPTDAINFFIKVAVVFGAIFASPFILYQVWLFISPGMYANEKRWVVPFMTITVALFLSGAWFGYKWVLPGAMQILIVDFGKNFTHMITIEDYTGFFLSVILGLGICFELPVLMFFLSFFGIVDGKAFLKHFRYAVLAIFVIAAIICPSPDPIAMCLFASPMLVLYFAGVAIAYYAHPTRRDKKKATA